MFDSFHYGVCYFPEHWPAARHESDFRRMKEAGFDLVRMGEGAWGYFEPAEGQFQFDLFDRAIALCRKYGLKVILGTPTYCAPAWVSNKYPEILRWDFNRIPMTHGSRRNFNYTSPKYYELSDRICTALAEHYKSEPQIIGWQLDNEFNCHMDVSYAPSDTIAFRGWLREKYKTLDRLNRAWGTAFWSQQYDEWEQIDLPHPSPTYLNPSQLLDETRFISDCVVRFAASQAKILRKANKKWQITHNGLFANVKGTDLTRELDFFSHDQYPLFSSTWPQAADGLVQARSLSFPFGILEQQSGPGGQMQYLLRTPKPGELRLWAWQSVAHGAKFVSYFRWRTCPYGAEQHWHGLLDADNKDTRRLAEAVITGKEFRKLPKDFFGAAPAKVAAILKDFDNDANERRINTYTKSGAGEPAVWLASMQRRHIPCDYVWPESNFRGYRVVVAPHLKIVTPELATKLTDYVKAGGVLVLGAQAGLKDINCHIVEKTPPGLLSKIAGIEIADWTTLADKETRAARLIGGQQILMRTFVESIRPTTAAPVAHWDGGDLILKNSPAITINQVGKGFAIYIAGYCPPETIDTIIDSFRDVLNVQPLVGASDQVEAIQRVAGKKSYLVLLNHGSSEERVSGIPVGKDMISGSTVKDGELTLRACDVAVIGL